MRRGRLYREADAKPDIAAACDQQVARARCVSAAGIGAALETVFFAIAVPFRSR